MGTSEFGVWCCQFNRVQKCDRKISHLNADIQLIATSNDSFLMDVIDIQYWNVLKRTGHVVTTMNAKSHGELFKKFKFTGLSNFDFFASDFLQQQNP